MEELIITGQTKQEKYETLLPQIASVIEDEPDMIANMANVAAMLHETFRFWWTGFYRVQGEQLVLGPFQGPLACIRIAKGRGVCGTAWQEAQTLVVKDVHQFPGHIACSSASQSEIVVPILKDNVVVGVLDIDSEKPALFDEVDAFYLEQVVKTLWK